MEPFLHDHMQLKLMTERRKAETLSHDLEHAWILRQIQVLPVQSPAHRHARLDLRLYWPVFKLQ